MAPLGRDTPLITSLARRTGASGSRYVHGCARLGLARESAARFSYRLNKQ